MQVSTTLSPARLQGACSTGLSYSGKNWRLTCMFLVISPDVATAACHPVRRYRQRPVRPAVCYLAAPAGGAMLNGCLGTVMTKVPMILSARVCFCASQSGKSQPM